ncbi:MAG: dipeptidase [Paracoccaceae bacterium]
MTIDTVLNAATAAMPSALERLFELLRIPSISTDQAYAGDCNRAADWLVDDLKSIGFDASRRDTTGHPMVVAHHDGDGPHILFYGHYDVQPVDPLDLWHSDPFDPKIEDTLLGKVIRARGASDDKGQLMTFVEACRALKAETGKLPCKTTILFEGEEESGSPSLLPFLKENADELRADYAFVCDTGMWDADTPAICTTLRGLLGEELTITAADMDLHSGAYGGPAANPLRVLSDILSGLHDETGRVTIDGFYDGVTPISNTTRAGWESLGFDAKEYLGTVGLSHPAGEKGFDTLAQLWARPTAEINGIWGGYTGAGFKTVLPAKAHAKISFRLVGQQDPHQIRKNFRAYVKCMLPPDCAVEFAEHGTAPATVLPSEDEVFVQSSNALSAEWPNKNVFVGGGGSIPIVGLFQEILGMNSVMIGFAQDDDQIHAPNEKYNLRSFEKGIRSWVRVLSSLNGTVRQKFS